MTRIYSAQPRFLTFAEASIVDRTLSTYLQSLEQQGTIQGAAHVRQILRDFVYFTSEDTLEGLQGYLIATGWQPGEQSNEGRLQAFYGPADDSGEPVGLFLPTSMAFRDSEGLVIRAMYFLAFLEDPDSVAAYDILLRVRQHAANQRAIRHPVHRIGPVSVDDLLRQQRVVKIDRKRMYEALLARDQLAYLCVDLECPQVGAVILVPATPERDSEPPLHWGRRCALYPLTTPAGVEVKPEELEQYGQAVLDALNFGTGDAASIPEATWKFQEAGEKEGDEPK